MKSYVINTTWIALDKVFSILGSLIVTILVARYLGPENMGMINYAIVLASFIVPFSQLGSDNIIFDRALKKEKSAVRLIMATLNMRVCIYVIMSCLFLLYELLIAKVETTQLWIDLIILIAYLFFSIDIYKPYYNGRMRSKINSLCGFLGLLACVIIRTLFIDLELSTIYFSIPYLVLYFFPFFVKNKIFSFENKKVLINKSKESKYITSTLKIGFPMLMSSLAIVFYTRFNQFVLSETFGKEALGTYNAALTLSLGWVFLPIAIGTSLLTKALSKKTCRIERISFIYFVMYLVSIPILFLYFNYAENIILLTYGVKYIKASELLPVMVFSGLFSAVGTITSRVIVSYSGYSFLMKKSFFSAILNICFGIYFVPKFGLIAIAYIQLITEILSSVFFNFFFTRLKLIKCYAKLLSPMQILLAFKSNE